MKVLLDKPSPTPATTTTSKETSPQSFFDFLTYNVFSDVMMPTQNESNAVENKLNDSTQEDVLSEETDLPIPTVVGEMDQFLADIQRTLKQQPDNAIMDGNTSVDTTLNELTKNELETINNKLVSDQLAESIAMTSKLGRDAKITEQKNQLLQADQAQVDLKMVGEGNSDSKIDQMVIRSQSEFLTPETRSALNMKKNEVVESAKKTISTSQKLTSIEFEDVEMKPATSISDIEMKLSGVTIENNLKHNNQQANDFKNDFKPDFKFDFNNEITAATTIAERSTPTTAVTHVNADLVNVSSSSNKAEKIDIGFRIDAIDRLKDNISSSGVHHVNININPPELGPISARIRVDKNKADLEIVAKSNHVVEIIKSQLPLLRNQFIDSDIHLDSIVVQNSNSFQQQSDHKSSSYESASADNLIKEQEIMGKKVTEKAKKMSETLIDTYI